MGSDDLRKDAEQLQLLVRRVEVEQRDDEDDRRTRPPTILREQQRSTGTTCVEVGGRTLIRLRKPSVGSAATRNRPKTARRATQDRPPRRRWRRRRHGEGSRDAATRSLRSRYARRSGEKRSRKRALPARRYARWRRRRRVASPPLLNHGLHAIDATSTRRRSGDGVEMDITHLRAGARRAACAWGSRSTRRPRGRATS